MRRGAPRATAAPIALELPKKDLRELADALRTMREEALSGDLDEEIALQMPIGCVFIDEARNICILGEGEHEPIRVDPRSVDAVIRLLEDDARPRSARGR